MKNEIINGWTLILTGFIIYIWTLIFYYSLPSIIVPIAFSAGVMVMAGAMYLTCSKCKSRGAKNV